VATRKLRARRSQFDSLPLSAVAVIVGVECAAVRDGNNTKGLLVVNSIAASTIPGMILIIAAEIYLMFFCM